MTLRKSQRSPEDILADLCGSYHGGIEAMADRLGIGSKTLYKKLSSSNKDTCLTLTEFSSIVSKLEEAGFDCSEAFQALCFRHDRICINLGSIDETTDEDLRKNGLQAFRELSDFTGELEETIEGGDITDQAMEKLEPKKRKLMATMQLWWGRVKARHAERKQRRVTHGTRLTDSASAESVQQ